MDLKKYLTSALVSTVLGCATVSGPSGDDTNVSYPEAAAYGVTPNVARSLTDILKDEFDYVDYMTIKSKTDNKNEN